MGTSSFAPTRGATATVGAPIALAVHLCAFPATASDPCAVDVDCPGTEICEGGTCVERGRSSVRESSPAGGAFVEPERPQSVASPTAGSVLVHFSSELKGSWILVDSTGSQQCAVPCDHWVVPGGGYQLRLKADAAKGGLAVDLPRDFGFALGTKVEATVSAPRWPKTVAWLGVFGGLVLGLTAARVGCDQPEMHYTDSSRTTYGESDCSLQYGFAGAGAVVLLVGIIVGGSANPDPRVKLTARDEKRTASWSVGPAGVRAAFPGGRWFAIEPGSVGGTF